MSLALGCATSPSHQSSGSYEAEPAAIGASTTSPRAVAAGEPAARSSSAWQSQLTPYLWLAGTDGEVNVRRVTANVDCEFSDVLDKFQFGASAHFATRKGNWEVFVDGMYLKLGDDRTRRFVKTEWELETLLAEFGLAYRMYETPLGGGQGGMLSFDVLGGGRYWYADIDVELTPGPDVDRSKDWIDPFVGGRLKARLNEKWTLGLRGDVGGFGIGSASDSTWNVLAWTDYRLSDRTSLKVGYRILDVDKGGGRFGLDTQLSGPWLGVTIGF
jgi:opacity protein-like surface antigen